MVPYLCLNSFEVTYNSSFKLAAERSPFDVIKMKKSLLKALNNTRTQRQCCSASDSHALHMLAGLTEQNTRPLPFVFWSSLCVCLVSKCSVWDRWAALMYSTAIYIHCAIFLLNYDCGRGGTQWLTPFSLSVSFSRVLSLCDIPFSTVLLLNPSESVCLCHHRLLSSARNQCVSRGDPSVMLLPQGQQVNKANTKEWAAMWTPLVCILSARTHTSGQVMSHTRGKHRTLDVGEVHRAEDGRRGVRRATRSTTGWRGRVRGKQDQSNGWMVHRKGHLTFPHN